MAQIHKGHNTLRRNGWMYTIIGIVMALGCIVLWFATMSVTAKIATVAAFLASGWLFGKGSRLRAGAKGERRTLDSLQALPEPYHVFTNVRVHDRMEADAVVVGPNGVFVVETKDYNGRLEGNPEDTSWTLHKVGRKGGSYTKKVNNPLNQLKKNIFVIANFLKMGGCHAWVEGCVVFSNPDMTFGGKLGWFDRIKVASNGFWGKVPGDAYIPDNKCVREKDVVKFITDYVPRNPLSAKEVDIIVDCLCKCLSDKPPLTTDAFNRTTNARKSKRLHQGVA